MSDSNLIPAEPIDPSMIISTTATLDPDIAKYGANWAGEWAAGTYPKDKVVYKGIVLYKSAIDSNTDDPEVGSVATPKTWAVLGKINPHRAFDEYLGTYTYAENSLEYVLAVDYVNRGCFFNMVANYLKIEVLDAADEVVWTYEYDLLAAALDAYIHDLFDYFFLPDPPPQRDIIVELPWMINALDPVYEKIRITLTRPGTVSLGNCSLGRGIGIGQTVFEPEVEAVDYSKDVEDTEGRVDLTPGPSAKRISGELRISRGQEGVVWRHLTSVFGSWAVFDLNHPDTEFDPLRTIGRIKKLRQIYKKRRQIICALTIKGKI